MVDIETARTALLVMDFQNDLVHPEGAFGSQGPAAEVKEKGAIENTARVLATARNTGLTVVHVAVAFRRGHHEANRSAPLFAGAGEQRTTILRPMLAQPTLEPRQDFRHSVRNW